MELFVTGNPSLDTPTSTTRSESIPTFIPTSTPTFIPTSTPTTTPRSTPTTTPRSTPTTTPRSNGYKADNLYVIYHSDPQASSDAKDNNIGYKMMKDSSGNIVKVPYANIKGETLYNLPGSIKFGPSMYVPNYSESVYLSKLTNETPFFSLEESTNVSGFCKTHANSMETLEEKCNQLSPEICSSTDCCVNFGGAKCVAGNEQGPHLQNNYSDFMIKNRDLYYYKGKCYGNCNNRK